MKSTDIKKLAETIEPMDWYDHRYLNFMPEHFVRCKVSEERLQAILEWTAANTHGRFAIAQTTSTPENSLRYFVTKEHEIGFENPAEATLYTLFFS